MLMIMLTMMLMMLLMMMLLTMMAFMINKIIIEGVIPLIHSGLSVLLGEYLYTRGERTSIKT